MVKESHSADRSRFAQQWLARSAQGAAATLVLLCSLVNRRLERPLLSTGRYGWFWPVRDDRRDDPNGR